MAVLDEGRWSRIALIYALSVAATMCISEAAPVLLLIARNLHPASGASIGWVMSIPALVAALTALLVGGAVDRVGDRQVLLLGGIVVVAGDVGSVTSVTMAALLWWRVAAGFGYVCMAVAAVAMVARVTQGKRRTAALALWSTVIPASFIVSFFLGAVFANLAQWRAVFVAHIVLTALLLVAGAVALPARDRTLAVTSRLSGLKPVLRSPWPYLLGASFAFNAFLQTGIVAALTPFLHFRIGATAAQTEPFTMLAMIFNIAGALAIAPLLNRGVRASIVAIGSILLCAAAGFALFALPITLASAIALDCAVLLGCGGLVGLWALLPVVAPSTQTLGATSGLITQVTLLGVLFGPPAAFAGLSAGQSGMEIFLLVALVGALIGLPVWLRAGASIRAATPWATGPASQEPGRREEAGFQKAGFH